MLSEELKKQIEQEANRAYNLIRDVGKKIGYKKGATAYAEKWQASEQRAERAEKALRVILHSLSGINDTVTNDIVRIATEALTLKTSSDE